MTKENWLRVFLIWLALDVGCLVMGKPQGWLFGFGVRGFVLDCVLGIIVLVMYIRG